MKKRIEEIVLMRGLAIFSIVLLHVTAFFMGTGQVQNLSYKTGFILNQFVRFSLPAFLVISGLGSAYNYNPGAGIRIGEYYKKRFRAVFIPYIIWSLIYFIFYLTILGKIPGGSGALDLDTASLSWLSLILTFVRNSLFGWNYVHLYFVVLIFQFYLIYPVIIGRLSKSANQGMILITAFVSYLLLMIYIFYFRKLTGNSLFDVFVKYYWEMFIAWYFYYIFGLVAGLRFESFKQAASRFSGWILVGYLITAAMVILEALAYLPGDTGRLTSLRVTVLCNSIMAVPFYFNLSRMIKNRMPLVRRILEIAGNTSFGIYFVHLLIIVVFSNLMNRILPGIFNFDRTSFIVILFLVTISISIICIKILDRIPYGYLITGSRVKKAENKQYYSGRKAT